jgi:hypothetical protein
VWATRRIPEARNRRPRSAGRGTVVGLVFRPSARRRRGRMRISSTSTPGGTGVAACGAASWIISRPLAHLEVTETGSRATPMAATRV